MDPPAETRPLETDARTPFFFAGMGLLAVAVALTGFATTFFAPLASGTFRAPPVVYVHGAAAFAWIAVFAGQPLWIRAGRFGRHRLFGAAGLVAATVFVLTTPHVGAYVAARDLAAGGGETALSGIVGTLSSPLLFASIVVAGVLARGRPETHKRLMLLATIVVLWPAWFRFRHYFPDVPRPDIVFGVVVADSLILVAALRDLLTLGRAHPVWIIGGGAVVAENIAEVLLFDSPLWRALAKGLYAVLGV